MVKTGQLPIHEFDLAQDVNVKSVLTAAQDALGDKAKDCAVIGIDKQGVLYVAATHANHVATIALIRKGLKLIEG